jgi:NADPH2:quinone reductase
MKALLCKSFGPPDALVCEDAPDPVPEPGEALADMKAAVAQQH